MLTRKFSLTLIIGAFFALGALTLAACGGAAPTQAPIGSPLPVASATATLLPDFAPTAQSAQANAQATLAEVESQKGILALTATSIALEGIRAEATNVRAAQQTQEADATANAQATVNAQATANVVGTANAHATEVAEANRQATAQAVANVQATQTAQAILHQEAISRTIADAKATLEIQRIQNQVTEEKTKGNLAVAQTIFWSFVLPVLVTVFVVALVFFLFYAYKKLLPALNIWLRTRRSPNGLTTITLDSNDSVDVIIPENSFGAAMRQTPEGVFLGGVAPDLQLQDRTNGRAAQVRLASALPPGMRQSAYQQRGPATAADLAQAMAAPKNWALLPPVEEGKDDPTHVQRLLEYCDGDEPPVEGAFSEVGKVKKEGENET